MTSRVTSYSGKTSSGKETFGQANESTTAQDYITNKKNKLIGCNMKNANKLKNYYDYYYTKEKKDNTICLNTSNLRGNKYNLSNKYELVLGLYTKVDLKNVNVMSDAIDNISPVGISVSDTPYQSYNLDPSGLLFGNNICGLNNIINYISNE